MTIKLLNISDWMPVTGRQLLNLPAPPVCKQSRQVRLQVNAGRRTRIDLMRKGHEAFHLWTGQGLETIEFYLVGEGGVSFQSAEPAYTDADGVVHDEEVDCAVFTVDGQMIARDFSHEEKFVQMLRPRTQSEMYVRSMEIALSSYDALIKRQQGEIATLKTKETANGRKGKAQPATDKSPAPDGGGGGAESPPEGGGGDQGAPATGDGKPAGDGPSKRPKGAGGSSVPAET